MSWGVIILLVLGGALAVEGLGWALAPDAMKRAYEEGLSNLGVRQLSQLGLLSVAMGALLIFAAIRLHG